jgi:hypothetical protein
MKTIPMHIRFTTTQVVTLTGRSLFSVEKTGDFLEVVRKRFRGGFYDKQFIPISKVVAFSLGEGGKDSTAYATFYDQILIKEIIGQGVMLEGNLARIIDDKQITHDVNLNSDVPNISVNITQPKFKEIEVEEETRKVPKNYIDQDTGRRVPRKTRDNDDDRPRKNPPNKFEKLERKIVRGKRDLNF